jgi:hypothetical protein
VEAIALAGIFLIADNTILLKIGSARHKAGKA